MCCREREIACCQLEGMCCREREIACCQLQGMCCREREIACCQLEGMCREREIACCQLRVVWILLLGFGFYRQMSKWLVQITTCTRKDSWTPRANILLTKARSFLTKIKIPKFNKLTPASRWQITHRRKRTRFTDGWARAQSSRPSFDMF
jgi:hypothetical protein